MSIVDTHIHLWDKSRIEYPWLVRWPHLGEVVDAGHLTRALPALDGAVFIEAAALPEHAGRELAWLADQAALCPFPVRVVAQLLVGAPTWWAGRPGADLVAGLRRVMHLAGPGALADGVFVNDARAVGQAGLPLDVTVRHEQLHEVAELCRQAPETVFVLDHLGKPAPHLLLFRTWAADLDAVAANPNAVCKLSSIAVQRGNPVFNPEEARRYVAHALEAFGADRCVYGTDWPVITHASSFETWSGVVSAALSPASQAEREAVLRGTALRVYGFGDQP